MTPEQRVKLVYPEAMLRHCWVKLPTKWDWYIDCANSPLAFAGERFVIHIVAGNKLLAYGGKYETPLWRRAWKSIEKEMLKKLES
jgi:hypothetical protein